MALTVVSFKWGKKYSVDYVLKQAASVKRNLALDHRYICITDDARGLEAIETWPIPDRDLLQVRDGCYVRLRMFDPVWQQAYNIECIVCFDLDLVITGQLDPLFSGDESVKLLRGGHFNPCIYNGSVQMVRAGAYSEVWTEFTVKAAERVATASGTHLGTDQTWLEHKLPGTAYWTHEDGIYGYTKPGWPDGDELPANARIVAFPGSRDPSKFLHLPWVRDNWKI